MPVTKSVLLRHKILDRCLQRNFNPLNLEQITEEVNKTLAYMHGDDNMKVSVRTIYADLNDMEKDDLYGASIIRRKGPDGKKYYLYENPNFTAFPKQLPEFDKVLLARLIQNLNSVQWLLQNQWLHELSVRLDIMVEGQTKPIVIPDENPYLQGREWLPVLYQFIHDQVPLELNYERYEPAEKVLLHFHPYCLKEFNNRWYVIGFDEGLKKIINPALDRIRGAQPIHGKAFIASEIEDWNEYYEDIVGVTKLEAQVEHVVFETDKTTAAYIASKPMHPSQKGPIRKNGLLEFSLDVIPNKELEMLLLSFGPAIKVLSPKSLVVRMKELSEQIYFHYH